MNPPLYNQRLSNIRPCYAACGRKVQVPVGVLSALPCFCKYHWHQLRRVASAKKIKRYCQRYLDETHPFYKPKRFTMILADLQNRGLIL